MPCDTIRTVTLDVGRMQPDLFKSALTKLGLHHVQQGDLIAFGSLYRESYNVATGKLTLASGRDVNTIKRAYSAQIVESQCKKFGWQFKETAPFEYQVIKR